MEEFDIENPLSLHLNDQISSLFEIESDHIPSHNYSQILKTTSVRRESISLISHYCSNFTPYLSYLAITYLDRFLSNQGIPESKPWVSRILAVSCVSLALKMRKTESSAIDIQNDNGGGVIFDTETIHRMELLILGVLKWRMRSITPFSFINFFISFFKLMDPSFTQSLKTRANDIIMKAQKNDMNYTLEYKPSIMAASALLSSCHELFPLQFSCFKNAISNCSYVNQEELYRCFDLVKEIAMEEYECVMDRVCRSRLTPVNVLDEQWWSLSSSDEMTVIVGGDGGGSETVMKRRKTGGSGLGNDKSFQLSEIQQF
ncbi:putative cyclin-D6-1 [Impatiens glandulifera]|uniref:putative cyclin-D6-1 n=1 Tax=Impatiens glandulifera TaxID=253017 RepID=UPI001FB06714|nr:putative cyclin-D6-1 [Impatiens glandulifera]